MQRIRLFWVGGQNLPVTFCRVIEPARLLVAEAFVEGSLEAIFSHTAHLAGGMPWAESEQ
jgi:hypothetical protein